MHYTQLTPWILDGLNLMCGQNCTIKLNCENKDCFQTGFLKTRVARTTVKYLEREWEKERNEYTYKGDLYIAQWCRLHLPHIIYSPGLEVWVIFLHYPTGERQCRSFWMGVSDSGKTTPWFRRRRKVTLCVIGWPPFASCGVPSMTGIDPQTLYATDSMPADLECDTIHPYSQYRYHQWHIDSYAWDNESHCPMSNSKNFIVTKACLHYSLSLLWQYSQKFLHECRLEIRMKSKPATDITGAWLHADLDSMA